MKIDGLGRLVPCVEGPEGRSGEPGVMEMSIETATDKKPVTFQFCSPDAFGMGEETKVVVAGQDLTRHTIGVRFESRPAEMAEASVDVRAFDGFDLTMPAVVTVNILPSEGCVVIEEPALDGRRQWRVVSESSPDVRDNRCPKCNAGYQARQRSQGFGRVHDQCGVCLYHFAELTVPEHTDDDEMT